MNEFKKGDKVIVSDDNSIKGWTGIVTHIVNNNSYGVQVFIDWDGDARSDGWMPPNTLKLLQTEWD